MAAGALALVGIGSAVLLLGCGSLSKAELRERLLALDKNRPVAELGLTELPVRVDLGGGPRELQAVLLRVPGPASGPEGGGPRPLVLVHGTPDTLFAWSRLLFGEPGLAGSRELVALELPGHGIGPEVPGTLTFEACARYVVACLEALDLGPVHLLGNSYGGEVVWRAATLAPQHVASVTLVDSSGYPRGDDEWLPEEVALREHPLADWGYLLNSEERVGSALAPHFESVPEGRVREVTWCCGNAGNWRAMTDLVRDENGLDAGRLAGLDRPALVVWGADDLAYDPELHARRFARDLPQARLELLPDTGHYPHEQRPEVFLALLHAFLGEVESR